MIPHLIVVYEGDDEIFSWYTRSIPTFRVGEDLWLELAVYPVWDRYNEWDGKHPKPIPLTRFKILTIAHSLQKTYGASIATTYKMEIKVKRIIE